MNIKLVNLSIIGYSLILISFIGFFAYYIPKEDSAIWQWIVLLLLGSYLLIYKTVKINPEKRLKSGAFDLLYFVSLWQVLNCHTG